MIKIAIIDSGVNVNHESFSNRRISGFSLRVGSDGSIYRDGNFDDQIGHGTAVYYLIEKLTKEVANNIHIDNIKIYYSKTQQIDQMTFEKILACIAENYEYDIINISLGITCCNAVQKMQKYINMLHNRGTVIVSAFDNNGAISFPAALDNVIGVDGDESIRDPFDFRKIENSVVNVVGKLQNQKVAWTRPPFTIVKGNSYTCCYVTAKIAKIIVKDGIFREEKLYGNVIRYPKSAIDNIGFEFGKMVVFPFNKEIHALAQYEHLLSGTIMHYYSTKFMGNVGSKIGCLLRHTNNNRVIENIDLIDWNGFDTLVLGHLGYLSELCKTDFRQKLISEAIMKGKNIYSFDDIGSIIEKNSGLQNKNNIYYPHIDSSYVCHRFGKMYKINTPVICVSGTSSSQGKFTLQLFIRQKLIEAGYKVGQLGTEPSSYLFGFDKCFPCGYKSTVNLGMHEIHMVVNQMIWDISQKNNDIILAGTQSSLTAYSDLNVKMFPTMHQLFFESIQPDGIILCINPFDGVEYITRNIKTAEGLSLGKVIGVVCFPLDYDSSWKANYGKKRRITLEKEEMLRSNIKELFGLKMFMLDKEEQLTELINDVLIYLSK